MAIERAGLDGAEEGAQTAEDPRAGARARRPGGHPRTAGKRDAGRQRVPAVPMRLRPRFVHPEIAFTPTDFAISLDDWSSMPSDHAMLVATIEVLAG